MQIHEHPLQNASISVFTSYIFLYILISYWSGVKHIISGQFLGDLQVSSSGLTEFEQVGTKFGGSRVAEIR